MLAGLIGLPGLAIARSPWRWLVLWTRPSLTRVSSAKPALRLPIPNLGSAATLLAAES